MPNEYTQDEKPMRLTTPLPKDKLLIERLSAAEAVSAPFEFVLDLLSTDIAIASKTLLGESVTVSVMLSDEQHERYFNGIVRRFVQGNRAHGLVSYRAEVVPSFWLLSLNSNCRIFQNKSVPDIVKAVFGEAGLTKFRLALTGTYDPRVYCVQYRETDLAFLSRLMEEEGMFYFFEHGESDHTMVIADASSAVKAGPEAALAFTGAAGLDLNRDYITEFEIDSEVVTGKFSLRDYNFETPATSLASTVGGQQYRRYDYPGNFQVKGAGDRLVGLRLDESEAAGLLVNGATNYRGLAAGQKLTVSEFYRDDANADYHVIGTQTVGVEGSYRSAIGSDPPFEFLTRFQAIPYATPFRPARVTPKALVHGSQTAVVVGPSGEEIYVDKYGRVKVQFFWDEKGKKDENSSCWVRVSTSWAGKQWGAIQIPRIGQEVVVHFLEGDPDHPIITGSVYNAEQMPPYTLPENMTQSGLKTRSSKEGTPADANELRFEDLKGKEHILFHAQKDLTTEVENDEVRDVLHDRTTTIKNNETKTITEGYEHITLKKGEQTITLDEGDQTTTITKGKQTVTIEGNRAITIKTGNDTLTVNTGNLSTEVKTGNHDIKVGMGNVGTKVDMGNVTLKAALGSISYDAMQGIELKVGQSSIKVDQMGVTIKGMMVKVEGQVQTDIKGLLTNVKADAMLMVKGAITMIN